MAWTPERKAQFAKDMAARRAAKKEQQPAQLKQTPQTKKVEPTTNEAQHATPQLLTFTPEQLQQLVAALSGGNTNTAAPAAFSTLGQQQTNANGQVVGSIIKFPIDADYYPDPTDEVTDFMDKDKRTRRLAFSENYYITWDWDAKPYDTKYGTSMREPTFHATLYANFYDDEGEDTGKFRIVQSLHFNEDESTALELAAEFGYDANAENMREVMNRARVERLKRWLLGVFFPEHNFDLNQFSTEEAIGGQVVRVVTKSNVKGFGNKTPKIEIEELQ